MLESFVAGDFFGDVAGHVGGGFERYGADFMYTFVPRLVQLLRFVYRESFALAALVAVGKCPPEDDSVVVRALNRSAHWAVLQFVLWALRAVLAAGIVAYLVWLDAPAELLVKVLEVLGY